MSRACPYFTRNLNAKPRRTTLSLDALRCKAHPILTRDPSYWQLTQGQLPTTRQTVVTRLLATVTIERRSPLDASPAAALAEGIDAKARVRSERIRHGAAVQSQREWRQQWSNFRIDLPASVHSSVSTCPLLGILGNESTLALVSLPLFGPLFWPHGRIA